MRAVLRAEWKKLWSVRRWSATLALAGLLTVGLGLLAAAGSDTDVNEHRDFVTGPAGQPVVDAFHFVHQPVTGDATLTVRVASQQDSAPWAQAGVMLKESLRGGTRYAAIFVTPRHGVHLRADFGNDHRGGGAAAPTWLRLTRTGDTVTGAESADGTNWTTVGTVSVAGLPAAAQLGFFVVSPPQIRVERTVATVGVGQRPTVGTATFDNVALSAPSAGGWLDDQVEMDLPRDDGDKPGGGSVQDRRGREPMTESGGVYTVTSSGDIGPADPPDDIVQIGLYGVVGGLLAVIPVAVLFVTSEYRRKMIHLTFAATPARGRVLAAKAAVLAVSTFAIGCAACAVAVVASQPILRGHGFARPGFPPASLTDLPVLRAIVLTGVFMAAVAVFSVGVGTIVRRSAAAVTGTVMLLLVPMILGTLLPGAAGAWLVRLTPAAGYATQRVKPPSAWLVEPWSGITPWTGLVTACLYAAGSMLVAWWLLRRRDA